MQDNPDPAYRQLAVRLNELPNGFPPAPDGAELRLLAYLFTPEEAAEYIHTSADRIRTRLPSDADRLLQVDVDDTYVEVENLKLDGLRTALIVDPPGGMGPRAREQALEERLSDDRSDVGVETRLNTCGPCCLGTSHEAAGAAIEALDVLPMRQPPLFDSDRLLMPSLGRFVDIRYRRTVIVVRARTLSDASAVPSDLTCFVRGERSTYPKGSMVLRAIFAAPLTVEPPPQRLHLRRIFR